tara:strand:- start:45 stop:278 length:234 start_codon:yes stop_codon:yes gene_type:complete
VEQGIMLVQQEVEDLLTHKQTDLEVMQVLTPEVVEVEDLLTHKQTDLEVMQVLTPEVVEVEDLTITVITKVAMEDQV